MKKRHKTKSWWQQLVLRMQRRRQNGDPHGTVYDPSKGVSFVDWARHGDRESIEWDGKTSIDSFIRGRKDSF